MMKNLTLSLVGMVITMPLFIELLKRIDIGDVVRSIVLALWIALMLFLIKRATKLINL